MFEDRHLLNAGNVFVFDDMVDVNEAFYFLRSYSHVVLGQKSMCDTSSGAIS